MKTVEYHFWVRQGGMIVAHGEAATKDDASRECMHYVMMYSQDGPCSWGVSERKVK